MIPRLPVLLDRLVRAVLGVALVLIPAIIYRNTLFDLMAKPIIEQLGGGSLLAAGAGVGRGGGPLKVAFYFALFAAMPWVLYQAWFVVAPERYRNDKNFAVPLLVASILLFYVGILFAYLFVFPMAFHFFTPSAPDGVRVVAETGHYMRLGLRMLLAFGLAFEIPVVVVMLALAGSVSISRLARIRGYVVIAIFAVAALLMPSSPLSLLLMAVPMWLLYEAGVMMAQLLDRKSREREAAGKSAEPPRNLS